MVEIVDKIEKEERKKEMELKNIVKEGIRSIEGKKDWSWNWEWIEKRRKRIEVMELERD